MRLPEMIGVASVETVGRVEDVECDSTQSANRVPLLLGLVALLFLALGGILALKMRHPIPGRIYRDPGIYSSGWTEKEVEAEFGSPGKVVPGADPPGSVKEWRGMWSHHVIKFDPEGNQLESHGSTGGPENEPPFLERLESFLGLDRR